MMTEKPNYKSMVLITLLLITILAFIPQPEKRITVHTDPTILADAIVNKNAMIHPDILAKWIIEERSDIIVVDLRSEEDFNKYAIKTSVNMPVKEFLTSGKDELGMDMVTVLVSNDDNQSSQVWLLLKMMGYENTFVLQGGANFWVENYVNPTKPPESSPDSEIFKYEFRKSAAGYFGGGAVVKEAPKKKNPAFAVPRKKKSKKARSGCS